MSGFARKESNIPPFVRARQGSVQLRVTRLRGASSYFQVRKLCLYEKLPVYEILAWRQRWEAGGECDRGVLCVRFSYMHTRVRTCIIFLTTKQMAPEHGRNVEQERPSTMVKLNRKYVEFGKPRLAEKVSTLS